MGYGGMSGMGSVGGGAAVPMGGNSIQNLNQLMIQLIAANPSFLTGGIPNKLLSQMVEQTKVLQGFNQVVFFFKKSFLCTELLLILAIQMPLLRLYCICICNSI